MRETALESVFGRAYTNSTKPKATARRTLGALRDLTAMWCGGRTLVEIEEWLLAYVRKHEGEVTKSAPRSSTAQRARRFAIRIAPDLGFLCGVLGQVVAHRAATGEGPLLPVVEMLPQMVRAGDHDRHHTALRQMRTVASRVATYEASVTLAKHFSAGSTAEMDAIRDEVTQAMIIESLEDFGEED
ncbi:hypothetical protein ACFB49_22190 [Sphingomonas sp. DBB INV C78]